MSKCPICGKILRAYQRKYCSNLCQAEARYQKYISKWKTGFANGSRGINAKNISGHIRRYLINKSGQKCSVCGWGKKNQSTGKVPLEVDHINGNSEDNSENNLRIICPNCHALSPNFRNLNKGRGRHWRTEKYRKNPTHSNT